jgi:tRNA (cmo5U34)-methyltransferase
MKEIENNINDISNWFKQIEDKQPEEMAGFFTARLDEYEEHMKNNFDIYTHLPALLNQNNRALLDLGCGTGLELDEIFKAYPNIKVTGIDMARPMLDKLKSKHQDKDITLFCADYFKHDFGVEFYDAAISVQSFHHFLDDRKEELYRKIYSSLKTDGIFIECDYTASSIEHEKLCLDFYNNQREKHNVPDDIFVHIDIPMNIEHRRALIKKAGFRTIETVFKSENTVTIVAYK